MKHAYIYDGIRTAFGRHGGVLAHTRPDDLLSLCLKGLLARNDVPGDAIEDVIIGCTNQAGEDARNVARHAALLAGIAETVAAQTQNRLCGSGLSASIEAARAIRQDLDVERDERFAEVDDAVFLVHADEGTSNSVVHAFLLAAMPTRSDVASSPTCAALNSAV